MTPEPGFFTDLALVFAAAVIGAAVARLLRQPMILGYVLGGVLIGPFTPGPKVSDVHTFELFAEIGVILLMFSIGLEFSLRDLLRVKWVALVGGPLGIVLSGLLGVAASPLLGWPPLQGLMIGLVVSVASTMVLARLLIDRGELHSRHGRVMIGITLVEDLAVVVLTVLLPALGTLDPGRLLAIGAAVGVAIAVLAPVTWLATKAVPALMLRVARTRSDELFLLVALAIGLGTAAFTQAVGLSLAAGAFLAGLVVSESDYAHETLARLLPMRDTFVAVFFVTIGALIDPASVVENLPLLGGIIGLVVLGKFAIWTLVVLAFRYPLGTAVRVAVGLTQIGEFSFILIQVARGAGHVGDDVYNATLAASLLTILLNATLVRLTSDWVGAAQAGAAPEAEVLDDARHGHVVICGFGRVGSAVGDALDTFRVPYVAIERDPDVVRALRARGVPCLFGDAAHPRVLHAATVERAALVIVALPEIDAARRSVRAVRTAQPTLPIIARAHRAGEAEDLRAMGADDVVQPELEAAAAVIDHSLRVVLRSGEAAEAYLRRFRAAMHGDEDGRAGRDGPLPEVQVLTLPAGQLADQSLREARIRERFGVTVVAVAREDGETLLNPPPDTVLRPGDRLRVFGLPAQIQAFAVEAGRES